MRLFKDACPRAIVDTVQDLGGSSSLVDGQFRASENHAPVVPERGAAVKDGPSSP